MKEQEFMVDTGFNQNVAITKPMQSELGMSPKFSDPVMTPTGLVTFDVCRIWIDWDGRAGEVEAYVTESMPLVGTLLMKDRVLRMHVDADAQFIIRRPFRIWPLSKRRGP